MIPISITVSTIWEGKVGVRDRYVKQSREEERDLHIHHEKDVMIIPFGEVKERIAFISKKAFKDKYSSVEHHLVYFSWIPSKPEKLSDEQLSKLGVFG